MWRWHRWKERPELTLEGPRRTTLPSFPTPNHFRTSLGSSATGSLQMPSSNTGSADGIESSKEEKVERAVSLRPETKAVNEGIYSTEGWCRFASMNS